MHNAEHRHFGGFTVSQSGARKFKKGELLFSENDPISSLLFIQSGRVKFFLPRGKGIDFQTLNAPFVTGELALISSGKYPLSAMAVTELSTFEIPLDSAKQTLENAPQFFKTLTKGLVEQAKSLVAELRSHKLELDPSCCPPEIIPRLFGGIYHTIKHTGKLLEDKVTTEIDWGVMKKYTYRIFNLPQDKVEAINNLLAKFGQAEFKYEKLDDDPEAPEQLSKIYFKNFQLLETFFEFYQFYFYKSGKQDILKYEEAIFNIVRGLVGVAAEVKPDKTGTVKVDLNVLLENLKKEYALNVTASHWQVLENKGLFSKRAQASDGKFYISFHFDDFQKTFLAWRFLREIAKWNATGSINPKDLEFPVAPPNTTTGAGDSQCPECKATTNGQQKFCGECGARLSAKAA
jgi:hypothetical protein